MPHLPCGGRLDGVAKGGRFADSSALPAGGTTGDTAQVWGVPMDVSLVIFKEEGSRKEFPLDAGKTLIGRGDECGLRIPLPEVSRKHAIVIVTKDSVTLRDLGSANGSYVNNRRISEQELVAGDHVVVGPVVFTVRIDGEPTDVKPVQTRLEARPAQSSTAGKKPAKTSEDPTDVIFEDDEEDDPISALEALAATDETTALDLDDSSLELQED